MRKTRAFGPGIWKDTCYVCQVIGKPSHDAPPAPLHPIPVADEAFTTVIIDCVGRMPKTESGCEYILTIMCSTTRFPEARRGTLKREQFQML